MDLDLDGKVVIVTGGTSGIGLATVSELTTEGAQVVAVARRVPEPGRLPETADFIGASMAW